MSKLIACYGPQGVGTTSFSIALAKHLTGYKNPDTKKPYSVALIFASNLNPPLPYLQPSFIVERSSSQKTKSLGNIFGLTKPSQYDILKQAEIIPSNKNLLLFGYAYGQSRDTYSKPIEADFLAFFYELSQFIDYIVVDCDSNPRDYLTNFAINSADYFIQTCGCDYKSICFFASNMSRLSFNKDVVKTSVYPNVKSYESPYDIKGLHGGFYTVKNDESVSNLYYSGKYLDSPIQSVYKPALIKLCKEVLYLS